MTPTDFVQIVVFTVGLAYLLLHLGPLVRFSYEPAIRAGTHWRFFISEVALFSAWALAFPTVWNSGVGRAAIAFHILTHVCYALGAWAIPDRLLALALERPGRWLRFATKEIGLVLDAFTHVVVVVLASSALSAGMLLATCGCAIFGFVIVTQKYSANHAIGLN